MSSARKPWWQQATALVSLSAGGAVTGFHFAPKVPADGNSLTHAQIRLLALQQVAKPTTASGDSALRSAIVNVATYYLRLAAGKTPAEMEALIWQHDSVDGVDHGESCAAFASLTLELAAQVSGKQSWVTGGTTYPWPLQEWADVRVDPNPASPTIISVLQDAETHHRWHPLGDGYQPLPGDWVLFHGHVEVVTRDSGGVLHTIGGDSLPNFSVNAHEYAGPLADQGVVGFVNNGGLASAQETAARGTGNGTAQAGAAQAGTAQAATTSRDQSGAGRGGAAAPGLTAIPGADATSSTTSASEHRAGDASIPGATAKEADASQDRVPADRRTRHAHPRSWRGGGAMRAAVASRPPRVPGISSPGGPSSAGRASSAGATGSGGAGVAAGDDTAAIPGAAPASAPRTREQTGPGGTGSARVAGGAAAPTPLAGLTAAEQAFLGEIAPGAMASQRTWGVPAAVTMAQAIDESGWGQSSLATRDHNLFGVKGTGPAGSDAQPTQEYSGGQWLTRVALFRVYRSAAESLDDHGRLLATNLAYRRAMAQRQDPDAFAAALTGVYATDPTYGTKLIGLMRQFDLYRYDAQATPATVTAATGTPPTAAHSASAPSLGATTQSRSLSWPPGAASGPSRGASTPPVTTAAAADVPGAQVPAAARPAAAHPAHPARSERPAAAPVAASHPAATPAVASHPAAGRPTAASPAARPLAATVRRSVASPAGTAAVPGIRAPGLRAPGRSSATTDPGAQSARRSRPAPGASSPPSSSPPPSSQPGSSQPASSQPASAPTAARQSAAYRPEWPAPPARRQPRTTSAERPSQRASLYRPQIPPAVRNAFLTTAEKPLLTTEPLYRDVASESGIRWELLAACDWMQCEAKPRCSPVNGERLGTANPDGITYWTKSEALAQCADDLVKLSWAVYHIDLTAPGSRSVRELASAFAAFRWGGLLKLHHTSALEFPYSVAGLTAGHLAMRWPAVNQPNAPDKPGTRFRRPFGAVPIVLGLRYAATV